MTKKLREAINIATTPHTNFKLVLDCITANKNCWVNIEGKEYLQLSKKDFEVYMAVACRCRCEFEKLIPTKK